MELLIDIPEWQYQAVRNGKFDIGVQTNILCSVIHGIPLPKGHGRIVDVNEVIKIANKTKDLHGAIWNAPTIIKADKEQEHDT